MACAGENGGTMVGVQVDQGVTNGHTSSRTSTPAPSAGGGTQRLQVTPENVVELAVTFRQIAERYQSVMQNLGNNLTLKEPWLGDPFSKWAMEEFNDYFAHGDNSVSKTMAQMHKQYNDMYRTLQNIAKQYGKTDELNKQLMEQQGPAA